MQSRLRSNVGRERRPVVTSPARASPACNNRSRDSASSSGAGSNVFRSGSSSRDRRQNSPRNSSVVRLRTAELRPAIAVVPPPTNGSTTCSVGDDQQQSPRVFAVLSIAQLLRAIRDALPPAV